MDKTIYEGYFYKHKKVMKSKHSSDHTTFWEFPWLWEEKDKGSDYVKARVTVELNNEEVDYECPHCDGIGCLSCSTRFTELVTKYQELKEVIKELRKESDRRVISFNGIHKNDRDKRILLETKVRELEERNITLNEKEKENESKRLKKYK